jgi:hypothetical protein
MKDDTPSVKNNSIVHTVFDASKRKIVFRQLSALDYLRLLKLSEPRLSQNEAWLNLAGVAYSILEIEGNVMPPPCSEAQIEARISDLGLTGVYAIAEYMDYTGQNKESPEDDSRSAGHF